MGQCPVTVSVTHVAPACPLHHLLQKQKNMTNSVLRGGVTGFVFLFGFSFLAGSAVGDSNSAHPDARAVLDGLDGGIVVHVGCQDGENTLKLGQAGAWVVRGLDRAKEKQL
jgi:hypothetical protein